MAILKRLLFLVVLAVVIFIALGAALFAFVTYEKIDVAALLSGQTNLMSITSPSQSSPPSPQPALLSDSGHYQTENNWIASRTAEEIASLTWLAVNPTKPLPAIKAKATVDPLKGQVHLELDGWSDSPVTADLTLAYAWDPKGWAAFAAQLLGTQKTQEPPGLNGTDLLVDLLKPTGQVLATKDVEISGALSQNPASAQLHEKAALLLLTVALRENAGDLSDIRYELCRASAHLAVARALEGSDPATPIGQVAQAALVTLSGREVEAQPLIDALTAGTSQQPAIQDWPQALHLLNKQDWRIASPDASASLLLKIAWFQVVANNFDDTLAMSYLDKFGNVEPVPDWGRALLTAGDEPSVDVGHRFCGTTIQSEFQELKDILAAEGGSVTAQTPLRDVFNTPHELSVKADPNGHNVLHVIGIPMFSDITERHIINAAWKTHFWMKNAWGAPDQDAQFVQAMRKAFEGERHAAWLDTFLNANAYDNPPGPAGIKEDITDMPPPFVFRLTWPEQDCAFFVPYFGWGIPFGAPYNSKDRVLIILNARESHHHPDPHAPDFRDLLALQPDSYDLASWIVILNEDLHVPMTLKDEHDILAPFFDYNQHAIVYYKSLADKLPNIDDATQEEILRKEVVLDPDEYYNLGNFLLSHGRTDEAITVYHQAVDHGNDQVLFANSILPLVQYDYTHGNQDEAMTLAQRAAEVYSMSGLETYIWLLCKLQRGADAEHVAEEIEERYGGDYMPGFYAAHRDLFPDQYESAVKKLFPSGMQTVNLSSFSAPPQDGCLMKTDSLSLEEAKMHVGDVVVALDGQAVHDAATYKFVRALSDNPVMDIILWRGGKYLELKVSPPARHFGNDIDDYKS